MLLTMMQYIFICTWNKDGLKKNIQKTVSILLQKQKATDTEILLLLYKHFQFLFK